MPIFRVPARIHARRLRLGLAAAVLGNTIYALGGYSSKYLNIVETFTVGTSTKWATDTPMITARGYFGAAVVDGKIVAVCTVKSDRSDLNDQI